MKKRHLQNCLSKEKKAFESNVKKYTKFIEIERGDIVQNESPKILKSVPIITIQPLIPRKIYPLEDGNETLPESPTSSVSKNDDTNEDMFEILKNLVENQKDLNARLEKLDENQTQIMQNQSVLSNGQNSIVANQQEIATKLKEIEDSIVSKPEMMAQSKLLMECHVGIKSVNDTVCRMTGETQDKNLDEVASLLPLQTIAAVQEVEQKLDTPDFAQAMTTYLHKLKGASEDVSSVIRPMFTDNLLDKYNWDGRCEKQALGKLKLFKKTLRDVFQQQGSLEFEKSVKKAVERSHHRVKQQIYLNRHANM